MWTRLVLVSLLVFVVNLPFGYWRARVRKLSLQWFFAIHLPIPMVVAIRFLSGLGFKAITFPFVILSFFLGQFVGGKL